MSRRLPFFFLVFLALQVGLLLIFVFFRHIDADEGIYLMSAHQVAEGKSPYFDFFYAQMPYLPYLYAPFSHFGFLSLFWGRALSALLCLLTSWLLYYLMVSLTRNRKLALVVFFLYAFNSLTLNWHSVIKTYAFSDLFGLLSFTFLAQTLLNRNGRAGYTFLAGMFVGLAFNCRLTFLPIFCLELMLISLFYRNRLANLTSVIAGALFSSIGSIYLLLKGPDTFLFNNWGWHQIWGNKLVRMDFLGKLHVLSKFIFYPQNLFILILALMACIYILKKPEHDNTAGALSKIQLMALGFSVLFLLFAFLPNPSQSQYYQHAIPYLLIFSASSLDRLLTWLDKRRFLAFLGSAFYFLGLAPFVFVFVFTIRPKDRIFKINRVKKVVQIIQENSRKDDYIFSWWNGYVFLSGRRLLPGNYTWDHQMTPLITEQQIEKFNIPDWKDVNQTISMCKPTLIIDTNEYLSKMFTGLREYYRISQVLQDFNEIKIYVRGEGCKNEPSH